jgi:DNA-binding transcriptional MerR regulator
VLALVDSGKVQTVIIAKLDRLTRSVVDLADLLKRFERHHVSLVSVAESLDTGSAAGRLVMNIMTAVSQWEREAIGERTATVLQHKRSSGLVYTRQDPYGYQRDGKRLVPVTAEQAVIDRIKLWRENGWSLRRIAAALNEEGVTNQARQPVVCTNHQRHLPESTGSSMTRLLAVFILCAGLCMLMALAMAYATPRCIIECMNRKTNARGSHANAVSGRSRGRSMSPIEHYRNLGYTRLMAEIERMLAKVRTITLALSESERAELQPALEALHDLTAAPGRRIPDANAPTFQEACDALGLSAATVRAWRRRTLSEAEICQRMGEQPRKSPKTKQRERDVMALQQLKALVTAIVHGQEDRAERLAFTLQDIYNW